MKNIKIDNDYSWSTHVPLLQSALNTFSPSFILELGVGLHSTKIFLEYNPLESIHIEQGKEWIKYIKNIYKFRDNNNLILHLLDGGIKAGTFLRDLTESQKNKISRYYFGLGEIIKKKQLSPRLLFVDNYTCCRTIAINILYKYFDMIIYHDCEPKGIGWYEYYFAETLKTEYISYILKTPKAHTGCFLSPKLNNHVEIKNNIKLYIEQYCDKYKINYGDIYLEQKITHA